MPNCSWAGGEGGGWAAGGVRPWCPQEGRPDLSVCCPTPTAYAMCCLPLTESGGWLSGLGNYLWEEHAWACYWALVALGGAALVAICCLPVLVEKE